MKVGLNMLRFFYSDRVLSQWDYETVLDLPPRRAGDILLAVNGHSLENVTHNHAVALLKSIRGRVTLKIVSWPGTLV